MRCNRIALIKHSLKFTTFSSFCPQSKIYHKDSPNKLYMPKQMVEDQLDDLELDGPITLRILDGIAWDFAQVK